MDNFEWIQDGILVGGVALAPLISMIISVLKQWAKLPKKWIPLLNVVLGAVAVFMYALIEGDVTVAQGITTTMMVVFGSSLFHDTFGNAGKALKDAVGKPPLQD